MKTKNDLQQLSQQLRCPSGNEGVQVAETMSQTNIGMILSGILYLKLRKNDVVLELGHGDGSHVKKMHVFAKDIIYHGLDISPLMVETAQKNNSQLDNTAFGIYNGEKITYDDNSFNKILTVNTLYFFNNPQKLFSEIYRVLKPLGVCVVVFADKAFMQTLPFTQFGFQLYDITNFKELVSKTGLKILDCVLKKEVVKSKMGDFVERKYYVVELIKKPI
ncbi:class I SAM-dependent methyltransferase [Corallibacter sp.]|uniref:class I SAM-dependent methyltransferase n=1 Tax=Corallibacter sp. TaxID=2038084 RepID=UPI003AB50556